ncbi:DUF1905 domain-containing protein [Sphingobacteriales bacterium UPWRP_1]|nr:hypothetical protein BVG80_17295 [Sphingobacteriales bacterium TSM_CSM]PSJ74191.1 DUF1905 domain-containing protein [Sphingobacteriales bacterium UPWRP_1]
MSNVKTFTAQLLPVGNMDAAYINIPFDVKAEFGRANARVKATFDGEPYRGSVMSEGNGTYSLLVLKEIRQKIGKKTGETVTVTLQADTEERTVTVPDDLLQALEQHAEAKLVFNKYSYTHRKEYVRWIEEAKKPETRQRRIQKAIEMIAENKKL